jgi:hypothetical protein
MIKTTIRSVVLMVDGIINLSLSRIFGLPWGQWHSLRPKNGIMMALFKPVHSGQTADVPAA